MKPGAFKRWSFIAIASWLFGGSALAGELSREDLSTIKADVGEIVEATIAGDVNGVMEKTHSSLVTLAGGTEKFNQMMDSAFEQLRTLDLKFVSWEIGEPDRLYAAGKEEVCFVPRSTVMEIDGKRVRSVTYMVAVRQKGTKNWSYLDGAGFRDNPEMLRRLLPELEANIRLPENWIEPL